MASERGAALVIVLLTMVLMMALCASVALTTTSEALTALNFRASQQALYAADAASEWAMADLSATAADWPTLLAESTRSRFTDGAPSGTRGLPDGSSIDLTAIAQQNAAWQPYAYGPLRDLMATPPAGAEASAFYVVVFVAADTAPDLLRVRAEAFGPRGAHKTVDVVLWWGPGGVEQRSWASAN